MPCCPKEDLDPVDERVSMYGDYYDDVAGDRDQPTEDPDDETVPESA